MLLYECDACGRQLAAYHSDKMIAYAPPLGWAQMGNGEHGCSEACRRILHQRKHSPTLLQHKVNTTNEITWYYWRCLHCKTLVPRKYTDGLAPKACPLCGDQR